MDEIYLKDNWKKIELTHIYQSLLHARHCDVLHGVSYFNPKTLRSWYHCDGHEANEAEDFM